MANAELNLKATVELGDESKQLLRELRDRLPPPTAVPADDILAAVKGSALAAAKREALDAVLDALDVWIEKAARFHGRYCTEAEPKGKECWRAFAPSDIRNMVNNACREVGILEFAIPKLPKEEVV